jgi:transposase
MHTITIGLDIAKSVFQVHGEDAAGQAVVAKRLGRAKVERFFAALPPALVGMEACGSAHHWARLLTAQGHTVRLMPAAYVKPYVKRNKTDGRDAEAICEAVRRPSMRFVAMKSVAQQCDRAVHRARDLLVRQRTQLMNAIRAMLAEMGIVAAQGLKGFAELIGLIEARDPAVPAALLGCLDALTRQLRRLDAEVRALEGRIVALARDNEGARRLMAIPGIGPVTAHAMVAAVGDGRQFGSARDFAAWVGLTPREASSGEKRRSGGISRAGDGSLRRLFVLGASSWLRQAGSRPDKAGPWLTGILARRPVKVAAVAQAAKTARIAWAVLTSGEDYRVPA